MILCSPLFGIVSETKFNLNLNLILIPKITLQPHIENAIIHGVNNMDEDGEIIITSILHEDTILITIEDNGNKQVDYKAIEQVLVMRAHIRSAVIASVTSINVCICMARIMGSAMRFASVEGL